MRFQHPDSVAVLDWPSPNEAHLPNIDLSISDYVAPCAGEMPSNPGPDAFGRLTHVDWDGVEITKRIDPSWYRNTPDLLLPEV